ncbi:MAG: hypothetical protein ACKOAV_01030, partial [Bacteroidota bacterium]
MRLAAIDLGSNAARLLVVKVLAHEGANPDWKAIEYIRVPVRLGDDVFLTGKVGALRRQQLLETMKGFGYLSGQENVVSQTYRNPDVFDSLPIRIGAFMG